MPHGSNEMTQERIDSWYQGAKSSQFNDEPDKKYGYLLAVIEFAQMSGLELPDRNDEVVPDVVEPE